MPRCTAMQIVGRYRSDELPDHWTPLRAALAIHGGQLARIFAWDADAAGADYSGADVYERDVALWRRCAHPLLPVVVDAGDDGRSRDRYSIVRAVVGVPLPTLLERVGTGELDESLAASLLRDTAAVVAHCAGAGVDVADRIVFDGTLALDGALHAHARLHPQPPGAGVFSDVVRRVRGWLARPLGGTVERRSLWGEVAWPAQRVPQLTAALDVPDGAGAAVVAALDERFDLGDARVRLAGLLAQVMPEEARALRELVDEAACVGHDGALPFVAPGHSLNGGARRRW